MSNNVLFAWKAVEVNGSSRESNVRTSMEAHIHLLPWKFVEAWASLPWKQKKCQKVWHDFFLWKLAEVGGSS